MSDRKNRKRLVIEMPDKLHKQIKVEAAQRGITVTRYVLQMLLNSVNKES